jgi:DNA-binding NarL/FixJ family response regulator
VIRVVLVDDQALVRSGFAMLLSAQDDMTVVGEAGDGDAAIALLAQVPADVVLMDIRMPGTDGVAATRIVTRRPDGPKVLVLTTFDVDEYVFAALAAGASGFLLKDARPDDLLSAIRAVAAGDAVLAPSATRRLLDHVQLPDTRPAGDELAGLTTREREVLQQIALGASNPDIAAALHLAESTVKTHVGNLLAKLGARDRVGLVLHAFRAGLVRPADLA